MEMDDVRAAEFTEDTYFRKDKALENLLGN